MYESLRGTHAKILYGEGSPFGVASLLGQLPHLPNAYTETTIQMTSVGSHTRLMSTFDTAVSILLLHGVVIVN